MVTVRILPGAPKKGRGVRMWGTINSVVDKSLPKFVIRNPAHILFSEPLVSMVAYEIVDEVRNEWRDPEKEVVKKRPCAI